MCFCKELMSYFFCDVCISVGIGVWSVGGLK